MAHLSWGKELILENLSKRPYWILKECAEIKQLTIWGNVKLNLAFGCGCVGFDLLIHSEFYKMFKEQDFNRDIVESFHYVPFIACAHAFSISK